MDKKTVIGFLIIGLILILTPYYIKLISPPVEETADSSGVNQVQNYDSDPGTSSNHDILPKSESEFETGSNYQETSLETVKDDYSYAEVQEITVETPLYTAKFSTQGATLTSWIIKPTMPYLQDYEQLVREKNNNRNLVFLARGGRGLFRTETRNFKVNLDEIELKENDQPQALIFTLDLGENGSYQEIYTFYPDKYAVDIHVESHGLGELTGAINGLFTWGGGMAPTELDSAQDQYYTEAYYYMGKSKEKFKSKGKKIEEENPVGPTAFVGQRTKYFTMALVPEERASGVKLVTWPDSTYNGKFLPKLFETGLVMNFKDGDINQNIKLYLGPLEESFLEAADPLLVQAMSWGWPIIKPFSVAVLWALKFMHNFIPNYGVVLIIFSILIKLIVSPLTHKSHVSMKRMQMLQPKLKTLQEKYKNNSQKLQQEMMALYKEHKVNPMGGCWPTLLQMPLLYALFIVFRSTIELRGAPFVLWINDLSMPDVLIHLGFTIPLYGDGICVLPLVMAISTYLQSKSTMTDPNQKAMLYMMPVMFIFLFNNFPSGLTLYYTLFNLLTWAQQKFMKISDPGIEKELAEVKLEQARAERKRGRN